MGVLDHGQEELLFVAEVPVDGLLADAGGLGDGVDAGAGVSLAQEHLGGGVEDRGVLGR